MSSHSLIVINWLRILTGVLLYGIAQITMVVTIPEVVFFLNTDNVGVFTIFKSPLVFLPLLVGLYLIIKGLSGLFDNQLHKEKDG